MPRWGRLSELKDKPTVGSAAYKGLPRRLRHLTAWRASHALTSHASVRRFARKQGIKPSSNLPLPQKELFVRKKTGK